MTELLRIALLPGDGIGEEVIPEAVAVLEAAASAQGVKVETTGYDLGAGRFLRTGEVLPDSVLAELKGHDAILLGAVGDPRVPPGVLERGLLLRLRFELDHHVNLRPVKLYAGATTPLRDEPSVDMVVVREGTEGPYTGSGGTIRSGTAHEVATQDSVNTRYGVERVVRYAFARAAARPRTKLTLVHKTNVLTFAGDLWQRTFDEVASDFSEVLTDYCHVDAATMYFVNDPGRFDVVVTDNLFGDILTDLGAAIAGGIGLAASGNLDPSKTNPSMFEPVHGSAPDIAGQGIADPTAAVLSVALLLEHLDLSDAAASVEAAVAADIAARGLAPRRTRAIGEALLARLR